MYLRLGGGLVQGVASGYRRICGLFEWTGVAVKAFLTWMFGRPLTIAAASRAQASGPRTRESKTKKLTDVCVST